VDRIAFVGLDYGLYVTDRNGTTAERLVAGGENMGLAYPTWSPDGRRLAYIVQRQTGEGIESSLYAVPSGGDEPTQLYASTESPAFYLYWSPDSRYVSFLTQEASTLALRLAPADGSDDARVLEQGSPFYWSWAPGGDELFMHIGGARRFSEDARLAIVSPEADASSTRLEHAPASFQSPAWSPDGNRILFAGEDENGGQALYLRERVSGSLEKLINVSGFVGFNWSPDGQWIAWHQIENLEEAPLGDVFVMPVPGTDEADSHARQVNREPTVAFFWSPDSKRLALLVPSLEDGPSTNRGGLGAPLIQGPQLLLRWWIAQVPEGEPRPLVAFRPTREFLMIIPYFDQYAQSIRFWSPDGRYLVYSDRESAQVAGIWLADVEAQEPPRRLGDGTLGVWSWQ
jgi:Tol biopolymer transport system component